MRRACASASRRGPLFDLGEEHAVFEALDIRTTSTTGEPGAFSARRRPTRSKPRPGIIGIPSRDQQSQVSLGAKVQGVWATVSSRPSLTDTIQLKPDGGRSDQSAEHLELTIVRRTLHAGPDINALNIVRCASP